MNGLIGGTNHIVFFLYLYNKQIGLRTQRNSIFYFDIFI